METQWLSSKNKNPGAVVSKEGHADSVLGHEKPIIIDFFKKGCYVSSLVSGQYFRCFDIPCPRHVSNKVCNQIKIYNLSYLRKLVYKGWFIGNNKKMI